MQRRQFKLKAKNLVSNLIKHSTVLVGHADDSDDQIFSFIIYRDIPVIGENHLYFAYTKLIYRNLGFFNKLALQAQNRVNFTRQGFPTKDKYFKKYSKNKHLMYDAFYFYDDQYIIGEHENEN